MNTEHDEQQRPASPLDCLVRRLREAAPLVADECLDEVEHCCEWTMNQDRKRLKLVLDEAADEIERLRECAWALWNVMDGMKDHDIESYTALPDEECERIAKARAYAQALIMTPNT